MPGKNLDRYEVYNWLSHQYDDKLARHQVIEDIYDLIYHKIMSLNLELKCNEDELYIRVIQFIINQTKMVSV